MRVEMRHPRARRFGRRVLVSEAAVRVDRDIDRVAFRNAPTLLRDGQVTELAAENMVLGVLADEPYQQSVIDLRKGDLLLLYTDGLADGMNYEQQMFGRQRIVEAFRKGGETAEVVAQNILWELRKFVGMNQRTDDVTMIVARVK